MPPFFLPDQPEVLVKTNRIDTAIIQNVFRPLACNPCNCTAVLGIILKLAKHRNNRNLSELDVDLHIASNDDILYYRYIDEEEISEEIDCLLEIEADFSKGD